MSILVTGGSGYLGSLVIDALVKKRAESGEDYEILSLDVREVPSEKQAEGVTYLTEDIRSENLPDLFQKHGVKTAVHLACIVEPAPHMTREFLYSVDVEGTENVLHACLAARSEKIIISSSGAAYGYHPDNPDWLTEDDPLRGNEEFAYSDHKRIVEEKLADYRQSHPQLQQIIFRIGTILGDTTDNQITALFQKSKLISIKGSNSPFVFIWDRDVCGAILQGIFSEKAGIYNVAGDGALSIEEIADLTGKKVSSWRPGVLKAILWMGNKLGISRYGPEQLVFIQYRPVLDNTRLKEEFGYVPEKTSKEAFLYYWEKKGKEG